MKIILIFLISPLNNIFRLDVIHSNLIEIIISIVGWIYFVAWSLSSYPQLILNWKTKEYFYIHNLILIFYDFNFVIFSVSGLSLDFIWLNFLGNFCYATFNIALYWIPIIQVIPLPTILLILLTF